jgi:hydrogenase maturation protease
MIVIGVGNAWRRDDGAGPAVARAAGGVCTDDPARLLDLWDGEPHVVVVDACVSGAPPGTIHRGDAGVRTHPASTHGFGVAETIELARAIGRAPARLEVYAIEGADFGHGEGLSPRVREAVGELARSLGTAASSPPRHPLR